MLQFIWHRTAKHINSDLVGNGYPIYLVYKTRTMGNVVYFLLIIVIYCARGQGFVAKNWLVS